MNMIKNKDRVNKAQDILLEERGLDYVVDCYETPDFVEVVGNIGGDVVTYRVYDDGSITAR